MITLAGLGSGTWVIVKVIEYVKQAPSSPEAGFSVITGVSIALLPILVGTVALAGIVISLSVDGTHQVQREQLAVLRDLRERMRLEDLPPPQPKRSQGDIYK